MPEGPEVTLFARQLHALLGGNQTKLVSISFVSGRYAKSPFKGYKAHLEPRLPLNVESVQNKGKYLSFQLSNDTFVGHSFGLTGMWQLYDEHSKDKRHVRMLFNFIQASDNTALHLAYYDAVGYGYFAAFPNQKAHAKKLATLGPSVADATLTYYYGKFQAAQKRKPKQTLVEFMMKQNVVCGIGNYLKCDILHAMRASPLITLGELNVSDATRLYNLSQHVYQESLNLGGSPHYSNIYGEKGKYVFKVYEDPTATVVKTPDGRKTYTKQL
jgi:formamidopyrimidine-DNA glycosylase